RPWVVGPSCREASTTVTPTVMVSAPSTRVAWCTTTGSRKPFPPFPRSISSWEGLFSHPIKLFFTCSQTHPKRKKGGGESTHQAQTPTPTQKNRGSNLLSHPTTGQYHQRKKTSRPGSKRDRV